MPKTSKSEKKPFRLGDVCKYTGEEEWSPRHIIDECNMDDGPEEWEYSTSQGAWIPHDDLELVEESSVKSRKELHDSKYQDDDDDADDDEGLNGRSMAGG